MSRAEPAPQDDEPVTDRPTLARVPVANGEELDVTYEPPRAVLIDGVRAVVWTDPDGEVHAARDVCPHRRAPLSAGTVTAEGLRCPYHGWSFDGAGRCGLLPAIGTDGRIPPKAQLQLLAVPDELVAAPPVGASAAAPVASTDRDWVDGDTPGLERFWHPVARRSEAPADGEPLLVDLLGQRWGLTRRAGRWTATAADGDAAWAVAEHLDHVWLAPAEPLAPLPAVTEWGEEGWHHRRLARAEGRFGVGLLIDNQLDAGHFPFVHTSTFGTPEAATVPSADLSRSATTVRSVMRIPIAATNDTKAAPGERKLQQHRVMHYEYHAPLWLRLRLDYEDMGGSTLLLFAFVPLGQGRARMDIDVLFRHPENFTEAELDDRVAFEERVIAEDLRLQLLYDDLRLPLDPTVEVHTKADRLSLQCRQVLRELLAVPAGASADGAGLPSSPR